MFHKVTFTCKPTELNRIRINCRCGKIETHEVPKAIEQSSLLLVCPACGGAFVAVKTNGIFQIRRLGGKDEVHFANPSDLGG
jgi:Zn finger protein HypA/HybF involved in hydrogenase expression